ncbi:MAG: adenylate/guanylate cyclase domain-containing protein [Candidatus Magasanikbacteria bacterium]|nr:adenylate/guanylate cyclase domain-containing protein [Candidatus Magasanikbacteria bacterium]
MMTGNGRRWINLGPNWATYRAYFERDYSGKDGVGRFLLAMKPLSSELARACADLSDEMNRHTGLIRPYPDLRVSMEEWRLVEAAMIQVLGHGWHLFEAGAASRHTAFGTMALKASFAATWLGRRLTSPLDGYRNVEVEAEKCLDPRNKRIRFVQTGAGNGVIVMVHDHNNTPPVEDFWSITSFIPGHGRGVQLFWGQEKEPLPRLSALAMTPQALVERYAPDSSVDWDEEGGLLKINGRVFGKRVYLPARKDGLITSTSGAVESPIQGLLPAIRVLDDVSLQTPCTVCRKPDGSPAQHPVLRGPVLLQCSDRSEHRFRNSAFEVTWRPQRLRSFFFFVADAIMRRTERKAQTERLLSAASQKLDQADAEVAAHRRKLRGTVPDSEEVISALLYNPRTFEDLPLEMAVIFLDMVGFTTKGWDSREMVARIKRLHELAQGSILREGGVIPKTLGDGGMAYFPLGYPGDHRGLNHADVIWAAIRAADGIHEAILAECSPFELRIAVHFGSASLAIINGVLDIVGPEVNFASRVQGVADPGTTAVSLPALKELMSAGMRNMMPNLRAGAETVVGQRVFTSLGKRVNKQTAICSFTVMPEGARPTQTERVLRFDRAPGSRVLNRPRRGTDQEDNTA